MNKTYIGSAKLHNNFKMFRVKYTEESEVDEIKEQIMSRMNEYLKSVGGKLINYKQLKICKELLFYFVCEEEKMGNWELHLKRDLLKQFAVMTNVIELGPKP